MRKQPKPPDLLGADPTLADLERAVRTDTATARDRRLEIARDLRRLAHALCTPMADLPAAPRLLHRQVTSAYDSGLDTDTPAWRSLRLSARAAMERWGLSDAPGRYGLPLRREWSRLFDALGDQRMRLELSRFVHHASAKGIRPSRVDDSLMGTFLEVLSGEGLVRDPVAAHRAACRSWNKAAAEVPGWPPRMLDAGRSKRPVRLTLSDCPLLKSDLERYVATLRARGHATGEGALRPSSIYEVQWTLGSYVSELLGDGVDPLCLRSASDIVVPELARRGLRARCRRAGNRVCVAGGKMAAAVALLASRWVRVPSAWQIELDDLRRRMTPPTTGLCENSVRLLRQFDGRSSSRKLLTLPSTLIAEAGRLPPAAFEGARLAQWAAAIELLLTTPLRPAELALLEVEASFPRGFGARSVVAFGRQGYLGGRRMEIPLAPATRRMLGTYLAKYRPLLARSGSRFLFPGRAGEGKHPETVRRQVSRLILQKTGIRMTGRMFPHFAAQHYLLSHPGDYGAVRAAVGHVSVTTTERVYSRLDAVAALRVADRLLSRKARSPATPPPGATPVCDRRGKGK